MLATGEGEAGDAGEVVVEFQFGPRLEELADGVGLGEAEFQGEEAVGFEDSCGFGDEFFVDFQAVFAAVEGYVGFPVADFFR